MMRTLRFGKVELDSAHERVDGHDFEDRQSSAPPGRFAKGTPWPMGAVPAEVSDLAPSPQHESHAAGPRLYLEEHDALDHALTVPVPREAIDAEEEEEEEEADPLPPLDMEVDLATRTLMGIGARAVRSVAKSGWVEARPATREPRATPDASYSQQPMPSSIDSRTPPRVIVTPPGATVSSSRRAIAHGSGGVKQAPPVQAPPVQPLPPPAEPIELEPAPSPSAAVLVPVPRSLTGRVTLSAGSPEARAISAATMARPAPTADRAKSRRTTASRGYRVLGIALLAVAVTALAAYITTTLFYAFSKSWVAPAVISQSDEKVVSLRSGLAAQQHQRDRLAAELEETARTIAAQKDPQSVVAQQASAHRKVLEASLARQDEIIKGLEQSPYLRALADRATVALVPYDNLDRVTPGTAVFACRVAMVMCREVGRVKEILPGEVAVKHPRREKLMRGQMIELQLSAPEAAAEDMLFLGGAPLLF